MTRESGGVRLITPEELYEFLMAQTPTDDWLEADELIREANGGKRPDFWEEVVDKVNREKQILKAAQVIKSWYGDECLKPGNRVREYLVKLLKRSGTPLERVTLSQRLPAAVTKLDRGQLIDLFERSGFPLLDTEK